MTVVSSTQLAIDFEPGLTERFDSVLECVRNGVYTNRNPLKTVAADMDMSQSELSRKLSANPDDVRHFTLADFECYLGKTGDTAPIYYLIERFLQNEEVRQKRAISQLARQLPEILALVKAASMQEAK